jgi:hypothetical protein
MTLLEAMRGSALTLALFVAAGEALGATTMESIGAEKCGGRVSAFEAPSPAQDSVALMVDGRPCTDARCAFQARKGET